MAPQPVVLISGFEPFAGLERNVSGEAARALQDSGHLAGIADVHALSLDVSWFHAAPKLLACVGQVRPTVLLMTGIHRGDHFRVERTAHNRDDCKLADSDGIVRLDQPIEPTGPPELPGTLPVDAIVAALKDRGVPATASGSAGGYLCNHLFYSMMYNFTMAVWQPAMAGFVHVPSLVKDDSAFTFEELVSGLACVAAECVGALPTGSRPAGLT